MKICLFGGSGLLGCEFNRIFETENFDFVSPRSSEVDLTNFAQVDDFIVTQTPDLIVLCVAYTAVDKAETEPEVCFELNTEVVRNLMKYGIPIIHFSTDYVFDAPADFEIPEDFPRSPLNVYGRSKVAAEEILEASDTLWWNIRTSWLFGPGGNNFVSTIFRLSQKHSELKIVADQIGRPTYAPDLAEAVTKNFILPFNAHFDKGAILPKGHYHLQNSGDPVSWADFARYFLSLKAWEGNVKNVTTEEFGALADRPKNSVFQNAKLRPLPDWQLATEVYTAQLRQNQCQN